MRHVCVPERGYTDVDQDIWSDLQYSQDFRRLHAEGILEVVYRPQGRVRLKGTCYVGYAICGDVLLEFREKVAGALTALLTFASHNAFRMAKAQAAASELSDLVVLLVGQFLDVVSTYTSLGRKMKYVKEKSFGSLVGGKLNISKSIQLRARGFRHLLAFEKNIATFNIPINQIILTALSEVERMSHIVRLPENLIAKSRGLSMLFADCRDHETLYRERSYFAAQALRLSESQSNEMVKDMMSLANVMLLHESFDSTTGQSTGLPRTWFINLENLFETAVRNVLSGICEQATVKRGEVLPQKIFSRESKEYHANPDLVISPSSSQPAIGDVKYKLFDGSASSSDVYQLLIHADAFRASKAFLIFPGDSYFVRHLGISCNKIDTAFFSVRIQCLQEDLTSVVKFLGLKVTA